MAILEVRSLTKHFGGLAAVNNVSFQLEEGELLGLIGPNGAGKTTLFNLISGVHKPTEGRIFYKGKDITGFTPHMVARKGVIRTFQLTSQFTELTVMDNILTGFHLHSKTGFWKTLMSMPSCRKEEKQLKQAALDILGFMGLTGLAEQPAKSLPQGLQRSLSLAVAIAANPALLLLDEPVTGMNREEVEAQLEKIRMIRAQKGVSILLVEHNMQAVMSVCDRIVVLNFGEKIAEGKPEEIRANPAVIDAYLGTSEYATS